jgi:hypothetical protein
MEELDLPIPSPGDRWIAGNKGSWPIEASFKDVTLFVGEQERDELVRLIARDSWPARWPVDTHLGRRTVLLTRNHAVGAVGVLADP